MAAAKTAGGQARRTGRTSYLEAMANRLAQALSPYLRQHADNPVDWWEWSEAAFAEASRRDVPVLLSVGYAACHWCHVMAHESFESHEVAAVANTGFVAIKVDREERPDVDAVYMAATVALTGSGGWPMTVLLTPDREPFWCGTYLPRAQLLGLLEAAAAAWADRRAAIHTSSAQIMAAVRSRVAPSAAEPITRHTVAEAVTWLERSADPVHGGFGRAPKFPAAMVLEFLLRHHGRTGSAAALGLVEDAATAMARGGIYDQLAGGFARYAVDAAWVVPHFEKMLYDNALLARVYAHWWRATLSPLASRIAIETCEFIIREMGTANGGFAASLDADTDGVEGLTYLWSRAELVEVLGATDAARAADLLSVTAEGTFEDGRSTLQMRADPGDLDGSDGAIWWSQVRSRLAAARATRPQPARDDKVVTSWNGLAIAALADVGALLGRPDFVAAARAAAEGLLARHLVDGRLRRVSRDGMLGSAQGCADDYGNLAEGLLALTQATGEARWLAAAGGLLDTAVELFGGDGDDGVGTFFDTAVTPLDGADGLLPTRPHSCADNAEPSGQASLAVALLGYAALTGSTRHAEVADAALAVAGSVAAGDPRFAGWTLAGAEARLAGPVQVAIVGAGQAAQALRLVAVASASPGLVLMSGLPDAPGVPLLAGRPLVAGAPAAYVCRGFVCDRPVTEPADLAAVLQRLGE
jgi:uncharacterized protein YyaL (SSP411 family)